MRMVSYCVGEKDIRLENEHKKVIKVSNERVLEQMIVVFRDGHLEQVLSVGVREPF